MYRGEIAEYPYRYFENPFRGSDQPDRLLETLSARGVDNIQETYNRLLGLFGLYNFNLHSTTDNAELSLQRNLSWERFIIFYYNFICTNLAANETLDDRRYIKSGADVSIPVDRYADHLQSWKNLLRYEGQGRVVGRKRFTPELATTVGTLIAAHQLRVIPIPNKDNTLSGVDYHISAHRVPEELLIDRVAPVLSSAGYAPFLTLECPDSSRQDNPKSVSFSKTQ